MGNRAVIVWTDRDGNFSFNENVGVYLHWNGGIDSVEAFLTYADIMGFRSPTQDPEYGIARFIQIVANFFGDDGLNVGVGILKFMDYCNGDNYQWICTDWEIKRQLFLKWDKYDYLLNYKDYDEYESKCIDGWMYNPEKIWEMIQVIHSCQPWKDRDLKEMVQKYCERNGLSEFFVPCELKEID